MNKQIAKEVMRDIKPVVKEFSIASLKTMVGTAAVITVSNKLIRPTTKEVFQKEETTDELERKIFKLKKELEEKEDIDYEGPSIFEKIKSVGKNGTFMVTSTMLVGIITSAVIKPQTKIMTEKGGQIKNRCKNWKL